MVRHPGCDEGSGGQAHHEDRVPEAVRHIRRRIAANWRDNYLDHFGQQQNNSRFGTEPTFVNANTQVDFSTSYRITPQINAYFSALNLNDATFSTHGRFSEQLLDVVDYGRRFTLGFQFKY